MHRSPLPAHRRTIAWAARERFGQIVDPRNGRPIEGYRSMSVASPSGMEAEVLSTALLVTPEQERAAILSGFSDVSAVEIVYDSSAAGFVPRIEWQYGF
jgi:thiamine biosynthesis lipoprotein ApbE